MFLNDTYQIQADSRERHHRLIQEMQDARADSAAIKQRCGQFINHMGTQLIRWGETLQQRQAVAGHVR